MYALLNKNGNKITLDEFTKNKNNYIKKIEKGLNDIIFCYIENGNIKYDYYDYTIDGLYLDVGKDGCFEYVTVEIGKIQ